MASWVRPYMYAWVMVFCVFLIGGQLVGNPFAAPSGPDLVPGWQVAPPEAHFGDR
jgi:hypothetical protein